MGDSFDSIPDDTEDASAESFSSFLDSDIVSETPSEDSFSGALDIPSDAPTASPLAPPEPSFGADRVIGEPSESFSDIVAASEDKGGFFTNALNLAKGAVTTAAETAEDVGAGFVEGAIRQAGSQFNLSTARAPESITRPPPESFAGQVGAGLGQFSVIGPTIAAGGPIGAAFVFVQGMRQQLNETEDQLRAESDAEGEELEQQVFEAKIKALPSAVVGEGLDVVLAATSAGTGGLLKGTAKGAAKATVAKETARQVTRIGKISNTIKAAAIEGAGEGVQQAGSEAAIRSTLDDTNTFAEFIKAVPTKETARAAAVGSVVGGAVRGTAEINANLKEGLAVTENAAKADSEGTPSDQHTQNVLEINKALAEIESPNTDVNERVIPKSVATSQELEIIVGEDGAFEVLPTEDGELSILRGKADRLRELRELINDDAAIKEETQKQEKKIRKSVSRAEARLDSLSENEVTSTEIIADLKKAERALTTAEFAQARIDELNKLPQDDQTESTKLEINEQLSLIEDSLDTAELTLEAQELARRPGRGKSLSDLPLEAQLAELDTIVQENSDVEGIQAAAKKARKSFRRLERAKEEGRQDLFDKTTQQVEDSLARIDELVTPGREIRKEIQQRENLKEKSERLANKLLTKIDNLESRAVSKVEQREIDKTLKKAGVAVEQLDLAEDKLQEVREKAKIEGLTKGELREIVSEVEGLEQFFKDVDINTLRSIGLRKSGKGENRRIHIIEETPIKTVEIRPLDSPNVSKAQKFVGDIDEKNLFEVSEPEQIVSEERTVSDSQLAKLLGVSALDPRPVEELSSDENRRNTNPKRSIAAIWETLKENKRQKNIVLDAAIQSNLLRESITTIATFNAKILNRKINQILGLQRILRPGEAIRRRSELLKKANDVLTGESGIDTLPQEMHSVVQEIRGSMDNLSKRLIEEGIVQGDLVQIVTAGQGTYVNRSYRVFDGPQWAKNIDPQLRNRMEGLLRRQFPKMSDADIDKELSLLLYQGEGGSPLSFLVNRKSDSAFRGILKQRKAIPEELRAYWGERTEALENYAQTVVNMAGLIATNKYLDLIKEHGVGDFLFTTPREGFRVPVKVTTTLNENGLVTPEGEPYFTSQELADELNRMTSRTDYPNWMKVMFALGSGAKFTKTVLTTVTQARNFWANPLQVIRNGHLRELFRYNTLKDATLAAYGTVLPTIFFNPDNPKSPIRKDFIENLTRRGVLNEDVRSRELQAMRDDWFGNDFTLRQFIDNEATKNATAVKRFAKSSVYVPLEALTALYRGSDAFFKVINFYGEKRDHQQAFPELSEDQIEDIAARKTRASMPTYSLAPELVQKLRSVPFMAPFVVFPAEVVRNQYEQFQIIKEELAEPRTKKMAKKRMAGMTIAYGGFSALLPYTYKLLSGTSDEEDEDVRNVAAPWHKTKQLLHLRPEEDGMVRRYINFSFSNPMAQIVDPIRVFANAKSLDEAFGNFVKEFAEPFVAEDVLFRRIADAQRNTIEGTKRKVYSEVDDDFTKLVKQFAHVFGAFEPGASISLKRVAKSENVTQEVLGEIFGLKVVKDDLRRNAFFKASNFADSKREVSANFNRVVREEDPISISQIRDAFEELKIQRKRIYDKVRGEYLSFVRLSGKRDIIVENMIDGGVTKTDMSFLEQGLVPQYQMGFEVQEDVNKIPGRMEQIAEALGKDFNNFLKRKKGKRFKLQ